MVWIMVGQLTDNLMIEFINVEKRLEDESYKVFCFLLLRTNKTSKLGECYKFERVGFIAKNVCEIDHYIVECLKVINDRRNNIGCYFLDKDENIEEVVVIKDIKFMDNERSNRRYKKC